MFAIGLITHDNVNTIAFNISVEALTCLTCQGIQQPRHCRSVEECAGVDNVSMNVHFET